VPKVDDLVGLSPSNHGTSAKYDHVVAPYTSSFLAADANVTNVLLQDRCPWHYSDHVTIAFSDAVALRWLLHALERPGPADPAYRPSCLPF
jgi:triacylglycerol lipase